MTKTELKQAIDNLSMGDLIAINNEICEYNYNYEDRVYNMDEFNEIYSDSWEATRAAFYGNFNPTDEYFYINVYGNLVSVRYRDDLPFDTDNIFDYLAEDIDNISDTILSILEG